MATASERNAKVNIDRAFHAQTNSGGQGVVIRHHKGAARACGAGRLENLINPLHAEILASTHGAQLVASREITAICFETDSMLLKQGVEQKEQDQSVVCMTLAKLKMFLNQNFDQFSFNFANRNCNRATHVSASMGCSMILYEVLKADNIIPDVQALLTSESTQ